MNSKHFNTNVSSSPTSRRFALELGAPSKRGDSMSPAAARRPLRREMPSLPNTPSPSGPLSSSYGVALSGSVGTNGCASWLDDIDRRYRDMLDRSGVLNINDKTVSTRMEDIRLQYRIGRGAYGEVFRALHTKTGDCMAVKVMTRGCEPDQNKRIIMDLEVVTKCHGCANIVKCYGIFISSNDVWICMELMSTCLDKLLRTTGQPIPEDILGKITVSIVKALHYLKEKHNIIHRDVKPSNMLLNNAGEVKLCDFGISGLLENSHAKTRTLGCSAYLAPERIGSQQPVHYDIRCDVWSLGVSLVELATAVHPYADCKQDIELLIRIVEHEPPRLPENVFSLKFTPVFRDFVQRCLMKEVEQRPKYPQLLMHDFLKRHELSLADVGKWYAESHACSSLSESPATPITPAATSAATPVAVIAPPMRTFQQQSERCRQHSASSQSSGYMSAGPLSDSSPVSLSSHSRSPTMTPRSGQDFVLHEAAVSSDDFVSSCLNTRLGANGGRRRRNATPPASLQATPSRSSIMNVILPRSNVTTALTTQMASDSPKHCHSDWVRFEDT